MHYTGTIWRPPYEAQSLLLEVTAGCTHHRCKFCTLYEDLPFSFKMSPLSDIEEDLREAQMYFHSPLRKTENKLFGRGDVPCRVFLTGANPFVLSYERLRDIALLIKKYFPQNNSIGCFARIDDIAPKTDEQLRSLHELGYDGITIGMETADDYALEFMDKGYTSNDILTQCKRLDNAQIRYNLFCLIGISGSGRCTEGARLTADVCNRLNPRIIGANMLTVYENSRLYAELDKWHEASETEKYTEMKTLIEGLNIHVDFAALGASNAVQLYGTLPRDKQRLMSEIDGVLERYDEKVLHKYRKSVDHL